MDKTSFMYTVFLLQEGVIKYNELIKMKRYKNVISYMRNICNKPYSRIKVFPHLCKNNIELEKRHYRAAYRINRMMERFIKYNYNNYI